MYKRIVQVRTKIMVYLTHQMALPILHCIRQPKPMPYSSQALQQLPAGTLGKDLMNMLEKNKLQLLPHYVKHDIKHILLGYETTDKGEVCLQSFMLGNGHLSFAVAATILFGLLTMPEHWSAFFKAYRRGEQSISIEKWPWFSLLELPTQSLIQKINKHENIV
jgi:ubiquinone biosynthesis protein Coq4